MKGFRYMHNAALPELSQPVCIGCGTGIINEWHRELNITGADGRCCS